MANEHVHKGFPRHEDVLKAGDDWHAGWRVDTRILSNMALLGYYLDVRLVHPEWMFADTLLIHHPGLMENGMFLNLVNKLFNTGYHDLGEF